MLDVIGVTSSLILYVLLTAAVIGDFCRTKVSNRLILTGIIFSLPLQYMRGGLAQVFRTFPNIMFPVIVLFLLYLTGILGAGDIKLFSLIGAYTDFQFLCACMVCSFAAGAFISLCIMVCRGQVCAGIMRGFCYIQGLLRGKIVKYPWISEKNRTHFSLAILIGVILAHWSRIFGLYGGGFIL